MRSAPADTDTIPTNCRYCGGPMEFQIEFLKPETAMKTVSFVCPYCSRETEFEVQGRLLWAVKRPERSKTIV